MATLAYEAVGATRTGQLPAGFRHDHHEVTLGDSSLFHKAKEGLAHWVAHTGAGADVYPTAPVADGLNVLVMLRLGPLRVTAPCRVVYVVDEPGRFGFGYGTLPGHPERGEESFVIERLEDATRFRVVAFSRPAGTIRLLTPLARALQLRVTHRYLAALQRYVADCRPSPHLG